MKMEPLDRREFLAVLARCTGGACLACGLGMLPADALAGGAPGIPWKREVDYYDRLPGSRIQCHVCPLNCTLEDGQTCFCRTRVNVGGRLYTRAYENPCLLRVDPIEKLPLNHYRPGTRTLTIGLGGCNLRCLYCQNWAQSQSKPDELRTFDLSPRDAVTSARKHGLDTIAFSYTEPVAFLEYALDVARLAKRSRLKVVVATAAFVEPEPLLELARYVDAFAVSLKGFREEFYKRLLGVSLAPVLTAIEALHRRAKCWLELVNLVVPTYNDDLESIGQMATWVHERLGDDVPMHFARFVPTYRLRDLPQTPVQALEAACRTARKAGLRYVYTSNIAPHDWNNTFCASCGTPLIERLGFKVLENRLQRGRCGKCHRAVPGVWR